jgi:tRNA U34 5-methylaminomethyl-2-thiouridine-forming methyltransferase MnmC
LYDLVFFDAFAPSKQAEMWEVPILKKCAEGLTPGGVLTTYCAKGQLKRDLAAVGLQVETLPGAPGKKEMVRAVKKK